MCSRLFVQQSGSVGCSYRWRWLIWLWLMNALWSEKGGESERERAREKRLSVNVRFYVKSNIWPLSSAAESWKIDCATVLLVILLYFNFSSYSHVLVLVLPLFHRFVIYIRFTLLMYGNRQRRAYSDMCILAAFIVQYRWRRRHSADWDGCVRRSTSLIIIILFQTVRALWWKSYFDYTNLT